MARNPGLLPLYEDLRRAARRSLPRLIHDFIDGGAGQEGAVRRNAEAFERVQLMPRVLVDPPDADLSVALPGGAVARVPFACAPMGMCDLAGPGTDRALALAAARHGFPIIVSTASSTPLERMIEWAEGQAWFQLYVTGSAPMAKDLIDRAWAAGYRTLVLTVDVPRLGKRPRDLRNGFQTPFRWQPRHVLDFATHPRWTFTTLVSGVPKMANFSGSASLGYDRSAPRRGADWAYLQHLRAHWKGALVVKGVMCPDDARRIHDIGADAIYVSNHGGRQLDAAPATLDVLRAVRSAVGPKAFVILDGGVRCGDDVVKARALGADLVTMGRPFLYACAAGGQLGLMNFVQGMAEDVAIALAQIGQAAIRDVDARMLASHHLTGSSCD